MAIPDPPLPEGSYVNGQILITSYFDAEGRLKYACGTDGEMNIAQVLGLLALSGISTYQLYMKSESYEPDEIVEDDDEEEGDDDGE